MRSTLFASFEPTCGLTMRTLHLALVALVCLASTAVARSADPPKYNVLFVAFDDLRPVLGCYGDKLAHTPNWDRLASRGVTFDRAYCQFPLCNPSRTSLLTGRHPNATGVIDNTVYFRTVHPDWISLPQHFKQCGYVAARTGKIFHGGIDDTDAWSIGGEQRVDRKTRPKQNPATSDRIVTLPGNGETHGDYRTATRAVELLEELKDQPFFLAVGFTKPHSPPTATQREFALFDVAKMPLPPDFAAVPTLPPGFPPASVPPRSGDLFIGREASQDEARQVIEAYYASSSFADAQLGRVLDALDRLKLADRTIIVAFGDHGYHLGEKGKWSKHNSLFEVAARVPVIICLPGAAAGKNSPRTVQLLDLYPTLVELCGLPAVEGLQGHNLAPLLKDPQSPWSHPAYTVARNANAFGQSVRTEKWRYSEWDGGSAGAVLFDEQADPHETKNLADDPQHAETVKELKALLAKLPPRGQ
jgi:arylsulfatase A-like enzyme